MRSLNHLNDFRVYHPGGQGDEHNGAFLLKLPTSLLEFKIVASNGLGWEHVSVSTAERIPKWAEMQQIKELFFEDHEAVMQLHPPKSDYVNIHPNCLHLWRPINQEIPLPLIDMV